MARKKKRVPFHIKNNLKKYSVVTTGLDIEAEEVTEKDEYNGGTRFYAKNQAEAEEYIERLKIRKATDSGNT